MTLPTTSVIVVSWQRPDALVLCLQSLVRQRLAPAYEIIVVADAAGLAAVASLPDAAQMKLVACDRPNISAARNLGLAVAAGQVVAFIDDDAQAEPRWLSHLVAPFAAEDVACTGGYVRGRNGISFQWTSRSLDSTGTAHPATLGGLAPGHPALPPGHALKTEGTNMAVRRDILCSLGGFDQAYRYYLDETDLNWRLHLSGYKTLLVPLAQVVHGFAPAAHRGPERRIRSLVEIGASQAVFLRRHHPSHGHEAALQMAAQHQRHRVLGQMADGRLCASDVGAVLRGYHAGVAQGMARPLPPLAPRSDQPQQPFLPFPSHANGRVTWLAGRRWQQGALIRRAASLAQSGETVCVFCFGPSTLFHHMRFHPAGFWLQTGGLWGRSQRDGALVQYWRFAQRFAAERLRIEALK